MSKYLLSEVLTFRCDMEMEAQRLVEQIKRTRDVVSHEIKRVEKKDETYYKVKVKTRVNSEDQPIDAYSLLCK